MRGIVGTIFSVLLIGASLLLIRRNPIYGLLILFTIGVMMVLSTAPRYYVMIMPAQLASLELAQTRYSGY